MPPPTEVGQSKDVINLVNLALEESPRACHQNVTASQK
jgi:hypothetical protein